MRGECFPEFMTRELKCVYGLIRILRRHRNYLRKGRKKDIFCIRKMVMSGSGINGRRVWQLSILQIQRQKRGIRKN